MAPSAKTRTRPKRCSSGSSRCVIASAAQCESCSVRVTAARAARRACAQRPPARAPPPPREG
eukprot:scaffold58231_cov33-Phaeocystis_antarctica.AAC.1